MFAPFGETRIWIVPKTRLIVAPAGLKAAVGDRRASVANGGADCQELRTWKVKDTLPEVFVVVVPARVPVTLKVTV
ncbi:hypothetical protein GCM10009780_62480 [Actinomadura alba]